MYVAATNPVPPRRSTRIREQAWLTFYYTTFKQLDTYNHLREVDVKAYEVAVLKHLLDMATRPDKEERKIIVRITFEFLCENTHIINHYPKFRTCVINKITELHRELSAEPDTVNNKPIEDACDMLYRIIDDERPKTYD